MGNKKKESISSDLIKNKSSELEACEDKEITSLSIDLRARVSNGESLSDMVTESFALVFEAIKRVLRIIPFDVQIQAAISMASGNIIELPTGEGKTIVAVFIAYYYALTGKGVHILTFNDFLAKRDALWMKPVYELLGVSVDSINEHKTADERKVAYQSDITYLTVKEAGYDYLRSFFVYDAANIVQRPFHIAIIDEADSIMIDNARVPLIVAGEEKSEMTMDRYIYDLVSSLKENVHYSIDYYSKTIYLTDLGYSFFEDETGSELSDTNSIELFSMITIFLKAEFLLKKDIDYIVKNNEILIVDEFTGRVMKDCKWSDGIQAAVEMKENLSAKAGESVMNRITIQNFLYQYPNICGMTGTAHSSIAEFQEFYNKTVDIIPPNKPCVRIDHPDIIFSNRELKHKAIIRAVTHIQKVVEGQSFNAKRSLTRYSLIYEQQRQIVHQIRENVLNDSKVIGKSEYFPDDVVNTVSSDELSFALKAIALHAINRYWSEHLLNMEAALDEVRIIGRSTSNPLDAYNRKLIEHFSAFEEDILNKVEETCKSAIVRDDHIDLKMMGIQAPASTKTYMLLDGTEDNNLINELAAVSNPFSASLFSVYLFVSYFSKRKKGKR